MVGDLMSAVCSPSAPPSTVKPLHDDALSRIRAHCRVSSEELCSEFDVQEVTRGACWGATRLPRVALSESKLHRANDRSLLHGRFVHGKNDVMMIKTVTRREMRTLGKLAVGLGAHLEANPRSLLCPMLMGWEWNSGGRSQYAVLVPNMLGASATEYEERFDLKGAMFNREATRAAKATLGGQPVCWQDNDTATWDRRNRQFLVRVDARRELLNLLETDLNFLRTQGLYDYSLYVAVTSSTHESPCWSSELFGEERAGGPWFVHVCLVDLLNCWDLGRQFEKLGSRLAFKVDVKLKGNEDAEASVIQAEPPVYANRLLKAAREFFGSPDPSV
eukprot:TRINITY_DN15601_c0_g1_i1.p1 TRINITY_DN15601_c0_g1~~TRINITY_DN15601_c0_g1_i1.p1  ORF type:complete len:332 (-),score=66.51 TRINITY_DN15601_c0_g1_i1:175-1170(-)